MEYLSKQQLVLLALLVSFVTSLATGIVTVSLMDQAPQNVTRMITQVIQKTVAEAVPTGATSTAAVDIAVSDQVADATAKVTPSIVRLRDGDRGDVVGLGLIVSKNGTIMADKALIDKMNVPEAIFPMGGSIPIVLSRFQVEGNIAFMVPIRPISETQPIQFANSTRLGSSVWSLSGASDYTLWQGIVMQMQPAGTSSVPLIETSVPNSKVLPGSPLFDATGAVIGLATYASQGTNDSFYYPVSLARNAIPQ